MIRYRLCEQCPCIMNKWMNETMNQFIDLCLRDSKSKFSLLWPSSSHSNRDQYFVCDVFHALKASGEWAERGERLTCWNSKEEQIYYLLLTSCIGCLFIRLFKCCVTRLGKLGVRLKVKLRINAFQIRVSWWIFGRMTKRVREDNSLTKSFINHNALEWWTSARVMVGMQHSQKILK
jgi:hypothetical protein